MRVLKTFLLSAMLACAAAPAVTAQSAEHYFHSGARLYVDGRLGYALEDVEAGLRIDPQDPKLLSLREKIRAAMERQQQRQQPEDENDAGEPDEQEGRAGDEDDAEHSGEQEDGRRDDADSRPDDADPGDAHPPQPEDPAEADPQQSDAVDDEDHAGITREQAEQLLQAVEQDERELLREAQRNRTRPRRAYPDW